MDRPGSSRTQLWRADASAMASGSASHSRMLPSMSVNSNVTRLEGNPIRPLCTPDPGPRILERPEPAPGVHSPAVTPDPAVDRGRSG